MKTKTILFALILSGSQTFAQSPNLMQAGTHGLMKILPTAGASSGDTTDAPAVNPNAYLEFYASLSLNREPIVLVNDEYAANFYCPLFDDEGILFVGSKKGFDLAGARLTKKVKKFDIPADITEKFCSSVGQESLKSVTKAKTFSVQLNGGRVISATLK